MLEKAGLPTYEDILPSPETNSVLPQERLDSGAQKTIEHFALSLADSKKERTKQEKLPQEVIAIVERVLLQLNEITKVRWVCDMGTSAMTETLNLLRQVQRLEQRSNRSAELRTSLEFLSNDVKYLVKSVFTYHVAKALETERNELFELVESL